MMNKSLMLDEIYGVLMRKSDNSITMNTICDDLKCSKKTIYLLFGSKNELLHEVHGLYMNRLTNLLEEVSQLDCRPEQRLTCQIRILDQSGRTFFRSHLFKQLGKLSGIQDLIKRCEQRILSASFNYIVTEMELNQEKKERLERILGFIQVSIKMRYKIPHEQLEMTDSEFLEVLTMLLLSFINKGIHNDQIECFNENVPVDKMMAI